MTPSLQITAVHLRVLDLARSVDFYSRVLGFAVVRQASTEAELAPTRASAPILTLTEQRTATRAPRDAAGLFHAALLFPSRATLAGWLQHSAAKGLEFEGFSDHGVSEAIYFSDPDGNGLEFYADRPREQWPYANGEVAMTTRPLAMRNLLAEAAPGGETPLKGTLWGHLHLRVINLDESETFYREKLGLDVMQRSFPGARFLGADGYHHHLGLNTWGGPRLPQPAGAPGLAEATFARAGATTETTVVDPNGLHLRIQPALVPA